MNMFSLILENLFGKCMFLEWLSPSEWLREGSFFLEGGLKRNVSHITKLCMKSGIHFSRFPLMRTIFGGVTLVGAKCFCGPLISLQNPPWINVCSSMYTNRPTFVQLYHNVHIQSFIFKAYRHISGIAAILKDIKGLHNNLHKSF